MEGDCCRCWYSINHNYMVQGRLQFCLPVVSYLLKENINDVLEYPFNYILCRWKRLWGPTDSAPTILQQIQYLFDCASLATMVKKKAS